MLIDFKDQSPSERYKLMVASVIPRPIAWVVTQGEVLNIAPFSYFTPLSSKPATMIVSIGHRPNGEPKDTLKNLRNSKKCVICIIGEEHFEQMHLSSSSLEPNESEIEAFNIETENILTDFPPVPKNIQIAYFCEYLKEVELEGSNTVPTIVEIKHLYVNERIITDKEEIHFEVEAIARVGRGYATLTKKENP
ncbi:MAG: Nitrilotriacetate monooxygenase component B (EC [uncultured Sulfurovum sp.]|uniref:Nitrilotriacetate monooxygenase component B (EC) n=1 Tax=uncultured Sulfurovum sp. TaxID=269237 RepID=A0A6S6TVP8_9BACT|nr:MAG: Nitrilotriacetate monooxygenase component B (EC [uncultured Sulfurovum sp.]